MVVDAFLFFNELELALLRTHELSPVVDRFVIVEATHTFSGKPKPLHFWDNRDRFKKFEHKIRHVLCDLSEFENCQDPWPREWRQRDSVLVGLTDCNPNDWVILADVDEIPKAAAVKHAVENARLGFGKQYVLFELASRYYYVNVQCVDEPVWTGLRMCQKANLGSSPQRNLRDLGATDDRFWRIPNAGWHFSYLGGASKIREKIAAFAHHREYDKPEFVGEGSVEARLGELRDPFDRPIQWAQVPFDDDYPAYLKQNADRFKEFVLQ